jgi:hypothetical protein
VSEEFELCPFCGADVNLDFDDDRELHKPDCYFVLNEAFKNGYAEIDQVQEAWNRRAETGRAG